MSKRSNVNRSIHEHPAELLQNLIRFDTTNPPGNEAECVSYVGDLLDRAGIETTLLSKDPARPSLLGRLKGVGAAPPLMLYGHADVVTTADQVWSHPPFNGEVADGFVWGRGALDMKGGVAMMLAALLRAKAEDFRPAGDIVFALLSDEEAGGDMGARFLVESHPDRFAEIRYALGEFGAFSMYVGGRKFYAVQIAEKQACWMRATVRGPGGHGSLPMRGGAMAKLSSMLDRLDRRRLPVHVTPVMRLMIHSMASDLGFPAGFILRRLLNPPLTDYVLKLIGPGAETFEAMLRNTVNSTCVRGGEKTNVIPSAITVELDARILPGYGPDDMIPELRQVIGDEVELEVQRYDPGPGDPDMTLFPLLAKILGDTDPGSVTVPLLLTGATDARFFSRLGIQTYGFLPMNLPRDFNFSQHIHAADERIPIESLVFGTNAIFRLLERYKG